MIRTINAPRSITEPLIAQSRAEGANLTDGLGAWIDCGDDLPEEHVKVLCVTKKNGLMVLAFTPGWTGRYRHGPSWQGDSVSSVIRRLELRDVTHWMPLPKAPNASLTGAEDVRVEGTVIQREDEICSR